MSDQATTLYQLALQAEPRPHARPRPGLPPQGPRLMVVTGVEAGVGTTTIAVQLARGLAQAGQTVVFLDADPRQAAASRQFGVSGRGQLGAWLAGGREVEPLLVDVSSQLSVMGGGPLGHLSPDEVGGGGRLSDVLGQLRGRSESTVVDAGPCQGAWAAAFSHLADVTLLVADHRDSAADVYAAVKKLACPAARSGRAKPPWLFFNRVVPPGRSESTQQAVIHTARRYLEIDPPPAGCLYEHEDPAGGLAVLVQTLAAAGIAAKTQKNDLCTQLVAAEGR